MVTLDVWFFVVAVPAVIFAGISKAGFGSGASFAAGAILAMIVSPGVALGVMLPLYIMMDATAIRPYWGSDLPCLRGLPSCARLRPYSGGKL